MRRRIAAKQRAYRARQAEARAAEQQAKGLPGTPPVPTIPARARWQALLLQARLALETIETEMQTSDDARSTSWQEGERGTAFPEELEQLTLVLEELAPISAPTSAMPAAPKP